MTAPMLPVLVAWLATVVALSFLIAVMMRSLLRLRTRIRDERIRSAFAEIRCDLVRLGNTGAVAPESYTYGSLYFLTTTAMRRDNSYHLYKSIMRSIKAVSASDEQDEQFELERKDWSPEMRQLATRVVRAIDYLLVQHSLALRVICRLQGGLGRYRNGLRGSLERRVSPPAVTRLEQRIESHHQPDWATARRYQAMLGATSGSGPFHAATG